MLRRRLQSIVERGHLATVTVADIRREMRKHGMKTADFIKNGKLTFAQADAKLMLLLLNEDLFHGGLTNVPFQADRKRPT
jgi:hypothetical protein